jgi:hypothetical protein
MMRARLIHRSEQPAVSHRWVPAALFAALVIAGLLGMHTFSTAHSDVHVTAAPMGATAMSAEHVHAASGSLGNEHVHAATGSLGAEVDSGCPDCGQSGSHHAMIMACVLGLLVTLLLVCRAKPSLVRASAQSIVFPFLRAVGTLPPRPPSLLVLSISRT